MHKYEHVEDYLEVMAGLRDPGSLKALGWFNPIVKLARYDVSVLNSMSESVIQNQALTASQGELAAKMILKYRRQLQALNIEVAPVAEPKFRMPFRVIDRTQELTLGDDEILMTFPYDQTLIDQIREFSKTSHGHCRWNRSTKQWCMALTEYNLNWAMTWAEKNNFVVDRRAQVLLEEIKKVEQQEFSIKLVADHTQLKINNAPATMVEYINEHVGELCLDNLTTLCDISPILGYEVDRTLRQHLEKKYGPQIAELLLEREVISEDKDFARFLALLKKYATLTDRFPLVIYESGVANHWLVAAQQCFDESEIAQIKHDKDRAHVNPHAQVVHTNRPLTHKHLARIPLMISTSGMIVGGDRQMMTQCAEKVVYVSAEVYNNKNPQRVKKLGNHAGQTLHT